MIKTTHLALRSLTVSKMLHLLEMRSDPRIYQWLSYIVPINEIQQEKWLESISLDPTKLYLEIVERDVKTDDAQIALLEDSLVGIIRSDEWDKINRSMRIGIDIHPDFQGKGYAQEAMKAYIEFLFNNLGLNRIWLLTVSENEVAIHIYKKLGFKLEGKQREAIFRNGEFHDYMMYGLLKDEYEG